MFEILRKLIRIVCSTSINFVSVADDKKNQLELNNCLCIIFAFYKEGYFDSLSFIMSKIFLQERLYYDLFLRYGSGLDIFLPPPRCFRNDFTPTSFANILSFLCPLTTSPIFDEKISNKCAPIPFAPGTICFLIKGVEVFQEFSA